MNGATRRLKAHNIRDHRGATLVSL